MIARSCRCAFAPSGCRNWPGMGCTTSQEKHKGNKNGAAAPNGADNPGISEHTKKAAAKNFGLEKHTVVKVRTARKAMDCASRTRHRLPSC